MAGEQATIKPSHAGALAQFLSDPAKVGFAALLLASVALLEGWLLWNKLRARAQSEVIVAAPAAVTPSIQVAPPTTPAAGPEPTAAGQPAKPAATAMDKAAATSKTAPVATPRDSSPATQTPPQPSPAIPAAPPGGVPKPAKEEKRPIVRKPLDSNAEPKRAPRKNETAPVPTPANKPVESPVSQPAQLAPQPATAPRPVPATPPAVVALQPIFRAPFQFPIAAARQGVSEGRVKARATIGANGNVLAVEILSAYPQRLFDRAVTDSMRSWRFPPGADRRSYEVEVEFKR